MSTIKDEGLEYITFDKNSGNHVLYNTKTGDFEVWITHTIGLKWRNTRLRYCKNLNISNTEKEKILTQRRKHAKMPNWIEKMP